jgi:cytochrome c556
MTLPRTLLALTLTAALCVGCVPKPKQDYSVDQLSQLDELEEVMRMMAHTADPWFAKEKQSSFTEAEFSAMRQAARVVVASSVNLRDRIGKGRAKDFVYHARRLNKGAEQLLKAAEAKDAAQARASLNATRRACKSCHAQFK